MLRDIAARGEPCGKYLGGRSRTRWQDVGEQRFELDVTGNGGEYRYALVVDESGGSPYGQHTYGLSTQGLGVGDALQPHAKKERKMVALSSLAGPRPRVKQETLHFDGKPVFRFEEGTARLFTNRQKSEASVEFPLDWHRSGLATVEATSHRRDNAQFTWFKLWLDRLLQVQINPWAMSARSEGEDRYPQKDLGNFANWYRHLRLESGDAVFEAMKDIREAVPGFEALDAKEAGLDVRVLQATLVGAELAFHDLSEGQRALIALYVLLRSAVGEDRLLLIDEPDNFIALAEIQPWLLKLLDRVDETNGQVMLVSHHPELLDQLAAQGGVLFERIGGGETRVRPFEPPADSGLKASEIIARGWEVENMYGLGPDTISQMPKGRGALRKRKRA
jgi:predicted ATPase